MVRLSPQTPMRLALAGYLLYSGIRKFEPEAPGRMEPLIRAGYPPLVNLIGFPRLFALVRAFELTIAVGLLRRETSRLAGAGAALFGGLLLVLLWRLPDTFHPGSKWRLTTKGMEHLKNVWMVGIGLSLAMSGNEEADPPGCS